MNSSPTYDAAYNSWLQATTREERKAALAQRYAALPTLTGRSQTNSQQLTQLLKQEGLGIAKVTDTTAANTGSNKLVRDKPSARRKPGGKGNSGQLQLGI